MSLPQDDSFNAIVARKRAALEAAASKKKVEISNLALPTAQQGENYAPQGDISFFEKDKPNNVIFGNIYGKGVDADSAYVDSDTGVNTGIRSASGMDTWEHSFYKNEQTARPAQIAHYSRLFGVPEEEVTHEMIFAMGRRADNEFRRLATEGQGVLDPETGTMSQRPGKQFEGFEEQMFFPEAQVTYDPLSKRYRNEKRVRVDSLINPFTGTAVYAAMNTPEYNTKWFKDSPKQNAVRKAYEAKHGTAYNNFTAPTFEELNPPMDFGPDYVQGRGDGYWEVFTKSVSAGVDNLQATGYGLAALVADRTGSTEFADKMLVEYQANLREARLNGANLPKVEDVDWTDPDQAYRQLMGAVGEFVPSIALGLGAGKLASMGTGAFVKHKLKNKLATEVSKAAAKLANTSAKVAGVTAFSGVGVGGIYGEVASEGFRDSEAAGMSLVGGLLVGALDSVLPNMIGKKLGITGQAKKRVVDTLIKNGVYKASKNVAKDVVKGKVIEGTTETLQEIIEKTTAELIKTGEFPDHTTPEALSEYLNVLVKASLGGGAIKGGTTAVTEVVSAINGNKKVVAKQTEAVLEEARNTLNADAEAYDSSTETEVDEAVTAIENVANEEATKLEQPKTLKQKILPTKEEKQANEEVLIETLRNTSDLGVALPEQLKNSSSVDKALYFLDSLSNAGNKQLTNTSGRNTTDTATLKKALINSLNKFKSGDTALNARIEKAINRSYVNEDYNDLIAKNPEKSDEFEAKRQGALADLDVVETEATKQVDSDKAKATKVIDAGIDKALNKVEQINTKLKDTTVKPKHRKRLEQERDNQMLHAEQLAKVNKDNLSEEMTDKVDKAADSFEYSHKKVVTVSDNEVVSAVVDAKASGEELNTVVKNEDSSELNVSQAKLKYLKARQRMLEVRNNLIGSLEKSTDKAFIKELQIQIKDIVDSIKSADAQYGVKANKIVGTIIPNKEDKEDTLNSLSIESLSNTDILSSIDPDTLTDADRQTYQDRATVTSNLQEINTLIKGNKSLEQVHSEVLTGRDSHFKGLNLYLKDAKEGKFNSERFSAFVDTLRSKANAFAEAKTLADSTANRVFISKETHEVLQVLPEGVEAEEHHSTNDPARVVYTAYKDYWWVDTKSDRLVNLVNTEAQLAANTGTLINQVASTAETRTNAAEDQAKLQEVNAEIAKIINKEPTGKSDLSDVKAEEKAPVKVETTETATNLGITKIISGAQTGSDIGGLKASKQLGIETGGTIPKGWKTAEGSKPEYGQEFNLTEDDSSNYVPRTMKNVDNADATIAVIWGKSVGTGKTIGYAQTGKWQYGPQKTKLDGHKPVLVITTKDPAVAAQQVQQFIKDTGAKSLNIAGHREGSQPGIEKFTTDVLVQALSGKSKKSATKEISTLRQAKLKYKEIQRRLKEAGKKTTVKSNNAFKYLAGTKGTQITFNLKAIAEDFDADMLYIEGKGKGLHEESSKQKAEVFKDVDKKAFRQHIKDTGGVAAYVEFIFRHELAHIANQDAKNYPKDLMHPDAIAIEIRANEAAFKAIGFVNPTTKQETTPEVVEAVQAEPVKAETTDTTTKKKTATERFNIKQTKTSKKPDAVHQRLIKEADDLLKRIKDGSLKYWKSDTDIIEAFLSAARTLEMPTNSGKVIPVPIEAIKITVNVLKRSHNQFNDLETKFAVQLKNDPSFEYSDEYRSTRGDMKHTGPLFRDMWEGLTLLSDQIPSEGTTVVEIKDGAAFVPGEYVWSSKNVGDTYTNLNLCLQCANTIQPKLRLAGLPSAVIHLSQKDWSGKFPDKIGDHTAVVVEHEGKRYIVDHPQSEIFSPLNPPVANTGTINTVTFSPRFIEVTAKNIEKYYGLKNKDYTVEGRFGKPDRVSNDVTSLIEDLETKKLKTPYESTPEALVRRVFKEYNTGKKITPKVIVQAKPVLKESAPEVVEAVQAEPVKAETGNELSKKKAAPKAKPTETEAKLIKAIAILEAQIKQLELDGKKDSTEHKFAVKRLKDNAKTLRDQKGVNASVRVKKNNNLVLNKFANRALNLKGTGMNVFDVFKAKDLSRKSFFSENSDTTLNKASIKTKLKALGITDTVYINAVADNFATFKDTLLNEVLPGLESDSFKKSLDEGVLAIYDAQYLLATKDGLPDEVIFSMMLSTMHWSAINRNISQLKPKHVIAILLYGDLKMADHLTSKQVKTFMDSGITIKQAAKEIGEETLDTLNIQADKETEEALGIHMDLERLSPAFKAEKVLIKDLMIGKYAAGALGLLGLLTASHMNRANPKKLIEDGLLTIKHGRYDVNLFPNDSVISEDNGKKRINTIIVSADESLDKTFETFKEGADSLKLIKGAESTLRDIFDEPVTQIQEKADKSFFDLPVLVKELLTKLQGIKWTGKTEELSLFSSLEDTAMYRLIGFKNLEEEHVLDRDAVDAANNEKIQDVKYVHEYIANGSKNFYYKFKAMAQHRIRIVSNTINGQRSKIHRALFFPASRTSTINTKQSRAVFKLAVGQAFGVDIDHQTLEESLSDFDNIYTNEHMQKLLPLMSDVKANKDEINNLINTMLDAKLFDPSMHVLGGIAALAKYDAKKSFKTTIGIETDGITNGYAIGLMQFMGGNPATMKERLAKVGIFVDPADSINSYEKFIRANKLDIYQTLSELVAKKLKGNSLEGALKVLHGELYDANGKLTKFARDLAKNPLMISNYGAEIDKVIKGIIDSITPGIYGKLAKAQTKYNNATTKVEKLAVIEDVKAIEQALKELNGTNVSLVSLLNSTKLDKEGNPTNLYGFTFKNTVEEKITKVFRDVYTDPMTEALDVLIGPIKEAREVIVQGIEAQYFAFMNAFNGEAAGVTNVATRMAIAGKLADKYMPRMSGPWSTNKDELIQLIKFVSEDGRPIQVHTKPITSMIAEKRGKDTWVPEGTKSHINIQMFVTTPDFDNPGVSSAINMVQNMDSVILGDLLIANGVEVLPIYDAVISSVTDAIANVFKYNKAFLKRSLSHSFLADVQTQLDNLFEGMPAKELAEVNALIKTEGYRAKKIKSQLAEVKGKKRNELLAELNSLSVDSFRADVSAKLKEVNIQKANLLKAYPSAKWTVSQMYLPESLGKLSTEVESSTPVQQELFQSIDIDAQVKVELEEVYRTDSNNPLRNNLQNIFQTLGKLHDTSYFNAEDKQTQQEHLQNVLDGIISKAGKVLDNTTVKLSKTNVKNHGYAHIHSETVDVNFNRYSPRSYSEQSAQEVYTHELLHILTRNALLNDSEFKENISRIRAGVKATLTKEATNNGTELYEIFLNKNSKGEIVFLTDEATEIAAAKAQYDHVFGSKVPPTAELDEFLAYALTNKFIVNKLSGMNATAVPIWSKDTNVPIYQKIIEMFAAVINKISDRLKGKVRPANLEMEIFELTKDIVAVNQAKRGSVSKALRLKTISSASDTANRIIVDFVDTTVKSGIKIGSDRYIKLVDKLTKDGKVDNFLANVLYDTKLVAYLTSSYKDYVDNHPKVQQHLDRAFRNFRPNTLRNLSSLKADMFGGVDQDFIKLLYKSHKEVDANRRQYKELTKESLQKVFKGYDKLTDAQKGSITRVLLKTDLSVLTTNNAYTAEDVAELVADEKKLDDEIRKIAKRLNIKGNNHYHRQTRELARIMITGKSNNHNQYLNAHVIYHKNPTPATQKTEQGNEIADLDMYISMLALKLTTKESKAQFTSVAVQEFAADTKHNGIHGLLNLHNGFKNKSLKEGFNSNPVLMSKGHISVITDPDLDIQVASADIVTQTEMRRKGYTYLGEFHNINNVKNSDYGIYVIKNNPELARTKGIMSATAKKAKGTSLKEILARDEENAGLIRAKFKAFAKKQDELSNTLDKSNYTMIPILNEDMQIVDYRINMQHSAVEQYMNQNLMFDDVLPSMFSHLEDKVKSEQINAEAIELLYDHGQANYKDNPKAFIDILSPKYREEYFMALPKQARWLIEQRATVNKDKRNLEFHVERKLLDTVFGYVNPSISNIRILKGHPTGQRYAKVAEKLIKEAVSMAVVNIVIKIPIVPAVNFASNFVTSMLYGVPPNYLIKHWREGMKELNNYKNDAKKLKLLDIEMLSNPASKKVKAKINLRKRLVHRMNNNPVAGLVDAGLFNSITEDINQNEFTYRNKGFNKIKDVGNKLFKGKVFDVANHAYLGEHTAVFKASMQFTQMSDFIARYTLYKYNTEQKGMNKDKAWKQMVETFVNYDQPMNRHLQYLNDMGVIMFVKYWLRIQRAGINLIKEKPLNVGMFWIGSSLLDVDIETILDSNIVTGNFFPTLGGFEKIIEEVIIPPGLEILSGKGF